MPTPPRSPLKYRVTEKPMRLRTIASSHSMPNRPHLRKTREYSFLPVRSEADSFGKWIEREQKEIPYGIQKDIVHE